MSAPADLAARLRAVLTDQPQPPQEIAALAGVPADEALRDALIALLSSEDAGIRFRQILPEVGPWRSLVELVGIAPDAIGVGFVRQVPPTPLLTADERAKMIHALGLVDYASGVRSRAGKRPIVRRLERAYRNYFSASDGDAQVWRGLVERGLAEQSRRAPGEYPVFRVTQAGLDAIWATRDLARKEEPRR